MRELPCSNIPDEAMDQPKIHKAINEALNQPEPVRAFDREGWLARIKTKLRHQAKHR